jgi:indole-3-glycerol phosphate synthase
MNILDKIVAQKLTEVARLRHVDVTPTLLRQAVQKSGPRRDFVAALKNPRRGTTALIAEVKKASPSAGVICKDFDAVKIAREYEASGASCLSVLTDEQFFQGSLEYLKQIRAVVQLPLLRKDFIIDPRQIVEAVEFGADAILLIVAILTDAQLRQFSQIAENAGLATLVEVHDEVELERAIAAQARLIGVNNRDLTTFKVDLATSEQVANHLRNSGHDALLVAESGIHTHADVARLRACGASAILVGESLMRHGNIAQKVAELLL